MVSWLTEELVALGHDITLFASGDSRTSAKLEPVASRSDLGRLVRFIQEAEVTVEQVVALINRLRAQGDIEMDPGRDRDRILLAVAERRERSQLSPGQGGRIHIKPGRRRHRPRPDRRAVSRREGPPLAGVPHDRALRGHRRPLSKAPAPGPLRRPVAGRSTRPLLRRARPAGLAPPDHGGEGQDAEGRHREDDGPPVSDRRASRPSRTGARSRADGKPAYTVATDATLREVIRQQPRTPDDLLAIKGIGPSFVDKHADSLLELLASVAVRVGRCHAQASRTMSSSVCSGAQPSPARARSLAATSRGGSPARRGLLDRDDLAPGHRARGLDDLAHRVAGRRPEVVDVVPPADRLLQRQQVRAAEVVDVDVVAHRGAVRGRVVGAEDRDALARAGRGLQHERDQMRLRVWSSPSGPLAPATLK